MSPQGLFDLPSTKSKLQLDQTDQIRLKIEHFTSLSVPEMDRELTANLSRPCSWPL